MSESGDEFLQWLHEHRWKMETERRKQGISLGVLLKRELEWAEKKGIPIIHRDNPQRSEESPRKQIGFHIKERKGRYAARARKGNRKTDLRGKSQHFG